MTQDQRAGAAFLPCPFCGGPPTPIVSEPSGMWHGLMCTHCPCKVHGFREWRDALNAWNTRASDEREGEGDELAVEHAEFLFATYAFEDDANLTADAQELKRRLRAAARLDKPAGEAGGCAILSEAVALYVKAREDQEHASIRMTLFYQMAECLKATRADMRRREAKPPEPKTGER